MRQSILKLLYVTCILCCTTSDCSKVTEDSLFLTPYIEAGKIDEAKQKALVQHVDMKDVESYSGYITINKKYNSNTFFWYFPAQQNSSIEPLILWMNGGPGVTSLQGLFAENGPFFITDNQTLEMRNSSWHKNHNLIYIDNPVGAGFSFTEHELGIPKTADDVGRDVLNFLQQFFKLFPELRDNDFFVTGESYAGKYVLAVSHAIKIHNERANDTIKIKGLVIGNGLVDPISQFKHSDLLFNLGMLDSFDRDALKAVENGIENSIKEKNYVRAYDLYIKLFFDCPSMWETLTNFQAPYNILQTQLPNDFLYFVEWVEQPIIKKAIHVSEREFYYMDVAVLYSFKEDMMKSAVHYMENLLESYKILLYHGQLDMIIPYAGTENYVNHLNWTGAKDYKTAKKKPWKVGTDLAGYVKTAGNLNLVLVRNSGHFAPTDQPFWTWDLITRFTHDKDL